MTFSNLVGSRFLTHFKNRLLPNLSKFPVLNRKPTMQEHSDSSKLKECPPKKPLPVQREIKFDPCCPFCRKIRDRCGEVIFEDDDLMLFKCENPVAPYHFQVVPRNHAIDIKNLKEYEKQLILKIAGICKALLEIYGADMDDCIVGYYQIPENTHPHLNFHVISPTREMSHINKVLYKPRTTWFSTIDQILGIE